MILINLTQYYFTNACLHTLLFYQLEYLLVYQYIIFIHQLTTPALFHPHVAITHLPDFPFTNADQSILSSLLTYLPVNQYILKMRVPNSLVR